MGSSGASVAFDRNVIAALVCGMWGIRLSPLCDTGATTPLPNCHAGMRAGIGARNAIATSSLEVDFNQKCNLMLGGAGESSSTLRQAFRYGAITNLNSHSIAYR